MCIKFKGLCFFPNLACAKEQVAILICNRKNLITLSAIPIMTARVWQSGATKEETQREVVDRKSFFCFVSEAKELQGTKDTALK